MNYVWLTLAVGAVGIGAYLVINSTQGGGSCTGGILDYINPVCWLSNATSELNTVLIILALVIVAVVALVSFGPGGEHITRAASLALV